MVGTTATATAAVTGDQSSASLIVIQQLPFVSFSLSHVNVSYFGNNVSNPAGAVALNNIYSASFSHVTFRHNVGNLTGGAVVVVSAVSTVAFIDCVFEGNSATYMGNNALSTYATGGALTVTSCAAGVTLLRCHFVNNSCLNGVTDGGVGGAACFYATNYVSIVNSSFIGNSVVGYYGQGGALVVENSIHVSLAQVTFETNSVVGDYGYGGALFMQSNTHVSLAQVAFDRSSVVGHRGNGGAFYMTSSTTVSLAQVAFTHSSVVGDNGGGGAVYIYSTTNVSLAQVAFGHNSVVGDNVAGGAFYLTQSTYISLAAVAFAGNSAGKTGSGGAIYMGQVGVTAHHYLFASHLQFTFPPFHLLGRESPTSPSEDCFPSTRPACFATRSLRAQLGLSTPSWRPAPHAFWSLVIT
jgi:predicted outer membrane repeat protein